MNTLTIMVGLPRSGKSTWIEKNKGDAVVISNDWIRENILHCDYCLSTNPAIWMIADSCTRIALHNNKNVIIDGVNLSRAVRKVYVDTGKEMGAHVRIIFIDTSVDICLSREEKMPTEKLIQHSKNMELPSISECDELEWL